MNKNVLLNTFLLLMFFAALAGCRREAKSLTPIPGNEGAIVGDGDPAGMLNGYDDPDPGAGGTLDGNGFLNGDGQSPLPDRDSIIGSSEDRETLAPHTVYFGFDRSSISTQELVKVEEVADYLKADAKTMVKVEGHCDERGTDEYNRALGERRALSIREVLIQLGVSPERITTESWGEDRPAVLGETESAHAKNRRGEFVLLIP